MEIPCDFSSSVTLQFSGDKLDPDRITEILGLRPRLSAKLGGPIHSSLGDNEGPAKTGAWSWTTEWNATETVDQKIIGLFQSIPSDIANWNELAMMSRGRLLCSIERIPSRMGFWLKPDTLQQIAARQLNLSFIVERQLHDRG